MPLKSIHQKSWTKGVVSVSNRFSLPKGSIQLAINLLLNERGALQACDGSSQTSVIPANPGNGAILTIGQFSDPSSHMTTKIAAVATSNTEIILYNINTNPATSLTGDGPPFLNDVFPITAGWQQPQLVEFGNQLYVVLGNNVKPFVYPAGTPAGSPVPIGSATANYWQPNHLYHYGDVITNASPNVLPAGFRSFICQGQSQGYQLISGGGITIQPGGPGGAPAGVSGATEPVWNTFHNAAGNSLGDYTLDNVLVWQEILNTGKGAPPQGAAFLINHAGALWAWNTAPVLTASGLDGPSVLRMSQLNNGNYWPELNVDYVAPDDGDWGTGAGVFTIAEAGIAPNATLVLFKNFSGYQVSGLFQTPQFAIQKTKSDMGCIAGGTVVFATGYGIMRLSHLGVALFDGVSDKVVSEEIRPYIFGFNKRPNGPNAGIDFNNVTNCRAALTTTPPMYVIAVPLTAGDYNYYGIQGGDGALIRMFCYDLVMQGWAVIDLPFKIASLNQIRPPGTFEAATYAGGFSDSTVRKIQDHDVEWDTGDAIRWVAEGLTVGEPTGRNYFHRTNVRLHAPSAPNIQITPVLDANSPPTLASAAAAVAQPSSSGIYGTNVLVAQSGTPNGANVQGEIPDTVTGQTGIGLIEQDYVATCAIAQTASTCRIRVEGSGKATLEGIEIDVVAKPPRAAGVQM